MRHMQFNQSIVAFPSLSGGVCVSLGLGHCNFLSQYQMKEESRQTLMISVLIKLVIAPQEI